jgi:hypothetical protein
LSRARWLLAAAALVAAALGSSPAAAQVTLGHSDDGTFEFWTTGRLGAFVEAVQGDGLPQVWGYGPNDPTTLVQLHPLASDNAATKYPGDPVAIPTAPGVVVPRLFAMRVRSGFIPNVLGFGVRYRFSDGILVSGYVALWATAETDSERTFYNNVTDEREGYLRIEGRGGSLLLGRSLSLFSRGATEIDYLYGHGFAVGNPAGFEEHGPSGGHIGYGVLANVFAAGIVYTSPLLAGFRLTAGLFDPATFVGLYWVRTKYARPEGELTYDLPPFSETLRLHLFANGAWQKMYASDVPRSVDVWGFGGGARLEVGRFHLGVAGHYGNGLGVNYALNGSDAILEQAHTQQVRKFDGLYAQAQVVLGPFDVNAGWGITRVHELAADVDPAFYDPNTGQPVVSVLKSRMGISGVVVYHASKRLHFAADYFRADVRWWLGERQLVNTFNAGSTLTW